MVHNAIDPNNNQGMQSSFSHVDVPINYQYLIDIIILMFMDC